MSASDNFTIELDCPPGATRPNDLIGGVLDGTGLNVADFETTFPIFGCQTWSLKGTDKDELFTKARPAFQAKIAALFNANIIRYGSW